MNNDYFSADVEIVFDEKTEAMQNTRNVKVYSIIEDNTFRLVRNYMGGQFDHSNDTEWALAILAISIKNDVDDIYKLEIDRIKSLIIVVLSRSSSYKLNGNSFTTASKIKSMYFLLFELSSNIRFS